MHESHFSLLQLLQRNLAIIFLHMEWRSALYSLLLFAGEIYSLKTGAWGQWRISLKTEADNKKVSKIFAWRRDYRKKALMKVTSATFTFCNLWAKLDWTRTLWYLHLPHSRLLLSKFFSGKKNDQILVGKSKYFS